MVRHHPGEGAGVGVEQVLEDVGGGGDQVVGFQGRLRADGGCYVVDPRVQKGGDVLPELFGQVSVGRAAAVIEFRLVKVQGHPVGGGLGCAGAG